MATLSHLKQKIKSIGTTKKITHAVRLTSMSLYTQMEKKSDTLQQHTKIVRDLFNTLVVSADDWKSPLLFPEDLFDRRPLFVVVASARGLCGSLNSNLFRNINSALCIDEQQAPCWIAIGQKAIKFVREKNNGSILCSYNELTTHNLATIADDVLQQILNASPLFTSVTIFHTTLKSVFIQKPAKSVIIPFSHSELDNKEVKNEAASHAVIWEQPREEIIAHLTTLYMRSIVINYLFQSLLAEHASRFVAMDAASSNADNMLDDLTLHYNKMRQAAITKEVSELSASSAR